MKKSIQDILVERSPRAYDLVMESPLIAAAEKERSRTMTTAYNTKINSDTNIKINLNYMEKMSTSVNSTLEDTTPSDSGVQMLDSESSELMVDSITSQIGFEFEEAKVAGIKVGNNKELLIVAPAEEFTLMDSNSNITTISAAPATAEEESMTASQMSTFDTTENIVFRRKLRKSPVAAKAPKKRVSFHEDILKNTRTDNIHIEHGFITYKAGGIRKMAPLVGQAGRYSWCSEGDKQHPTEISHHQEAEYGNGDSDDANKRRRRIVYRNACSDVLDYGNSDVYDMNDIAALNYDNSGVFEYMPKDLKEDPTGKCEHKIREKKPELYKCSCSSSNSSLDSDQNDKNSNNHQYGQSKSSSCDCIGMTNNTNNNFIGENCYYSEPNIDFNESSPRQKSVWNKEKKPKSSCLKKSKCQTNIIHEQDLTAKMKKFNVHDMNQLLDNSSKMIFGSLKSIFTMPLPERGVAEGSEDLQSVIECVAELEQNTPEHNSAKELETQFSESPPLKQKPFLSKSLDGSKQQQRIKKFVHNVDEQLRRKNKEDLYATTIQNNDENNQEIKTNLNSSTTKTATPPLQRQQEFDADHDNNSSPSSLVASAVNSAATSACETTECTPFRNKFIINCESTVFEHTGISYCYESSSFNDLTNMEDSQGSIASLIEKDTPIAQPEPDQLRSAFISAPIAKTFSNFFRSFKDAGKDKQKNSLKKVIANKTQQEAKQLQQATDNYFALKLPKTPINMSSSLANGTPSKLSKLPTTTSSSYISELTTNTNTSNFYTQVKLQHQMTNTSFNSDIASDSVGSITATTGQRDSLAIVTDYWSNLDKQSRHLSSPLKKGLSSVGSNLLQFQEQPQRYGTSAQHQTNYSAVSLDVYNNYIGGCGRDSKSTILSEEFDDILTITTDTERNESDIVIVDYHDVNGRQNVTDYNSPLKPPSQPLAKTSLINRFLRNVTQKKILETSMRCNNNFFAHKLKTEQKLFTGQLYVKGAKPKNFELIDDLNAEIAMELEMSGVNSPRKELTSLDAGLPGDLSRFELGIGEISIDVFAGVQLHILRDDSEQLMKVFKLYTGYSKEGYMTPVLVLLTDQTLYVADLVRNRLCSKFILAYKDLDVILLGPSGNTVLLSNSNRDMQQVLLAGGPYPAAGLVANLELCSRRSGSILPAVGQLTLDHLACLQYFVRENSCVNKSDSWMYYAVVNVPGSAINDPADQEPLGPHAKGFLMHRRIKEHMGSSKQHAWDPGYFLLKAGVLYMFNDSTQKIPSWAMALAECQGARRAVKAQRPHCFEILLKNKMLLQLAAPDEYVSSEWLQALLQSASGLFEMQEKHKTLGCTLVITQNHFITLREDFTSPLRRISKAEEQKKLVENLATTLNPQEEDDRHYTNETGSLLNSAMSTPTRNTQCSSSSVNSTPTKLSQFSRSTITYNTTLATSTLASHSTQASITTTTNSKRTQPTQQFSCSNNAPQLILQQQKSEYSSGRPSKISSVYGKNSGLEILTCADIKDMTGVKIPSLNDTWWCILEFSCQEVRECSDDLVIFFASGNEMQRFLRLLEQLWQAKNNDLFPITVLDEDDIVAEQCTMLYMDINRSWEPLLSAALGYPL